MLRVGFVSGVSVTGDQIVKDALTQLDCLMTFGSLSGGSLLKIDGPASLAVSYLIAWKLSHPTLLYKAIAVYDPKIGTNGKKTYIITITDGTEYQLGELIQTDEPQAEKFKLKVVLCGPPNSGKSCLREGLKQAILRIDRAPYPYIITACPDGEGSWYSKAAERDLELARRLKDEYKAKFSLDFAEKAASWVRSANTPLNIIDVGGKLSEDNEITPENQLIMREATHAIILASDLNAVPAWLEGCEKLKLPVIAIIYSHLAGKKDYIWNNSPVLTGIVHHLERGVDVSSRLMVQTLAKLIVELSR